MQPTSKERAIALIRNGMNHDAISAVLGIGRDDLHRLLLEDEPVDVDLSSGQYHVFDVEGLVIPAGTADGTLIELGAFSIPIQTGLIITMFLEMADPAGESDIVYIEAWDAVQYVTRHSLSLGGIWAGTTDAEKLAGHFTELGNTEVPDRRATIYGKLNVSSAPNPVTQVDLTIVRARAAFAII